MNNSTEPQANFPVLNSALHVMILVVFGIPQLTISVISILALLTAKDVNWKMKVILINILVPDVIYFLSATFFHLGYPVRVYLIEENDTDALDVSCLIFLVLYAIAFFGNAFGGALFSVSVYIFTKYGVKKLKWIGIVSYIATTWVISIMYNSLAPTLNLNNIGITSRHGFCIFELNQFLIALYIIDFLLVVLNITSVMIFGTCNFFFVRNNQVATENSDGPNPLKKAMTKVMVVYGVREICTLIQIATNAIVFGELDYVSLIVQYAIHYILLIIQSLILLLVPISIAIFMKPVNDRLKQIFKLLRPLHSYCEICKRDGE